MGPPQQLFLEVVTWCLSKILWFLVFNPLSVSVTSQTEKSTEQILVEITSKGYTGPRSSMAARDSSDPGPQFRAAHNSLGAQRFCAPNSLKATARMPQCSAFGPSHPQVAVPVEPLFPGWNFCLKPSSRINWMTLHINSQRNGERPSPHRSPAPHPGQLAPGSPVRNRTVTAPSLGRSPAVNPLRLSTDL